MSHRSGIGMRAGWVLLTGALALGAVSAAVRAQEQGAEKPFTIRRTVRQVVLDVVVTDEHGDAVTGLKQSDFTVSENGAAQTIDSFQEYKTAPLSNAGVRQLPPLPAGMYTNIATEPERGPLYAIVYDAVNMRQEDQPQARRQLQEFLRSKPAGTRFALFLLADDLRLLQGFTADTGKLLEAFDTRRKDDHVPLIFLPGINFGADDLNMPLEAMGIIGKFLEGLPGRKNLIWMSSEFPQPAALELALVQNESGTGKDSPAGGSSVTPSPDSPLQAQGFTDVLGEGNKSESDRITREAINALNAGQVSVYPINVGGVRPDLNGIDTVATRLAQATGGQAYFNTNNFSAALRQATENGANYYEISYDPADARMDYRMRRIRVMLDREGDRLEYRRFYYAEDPDATAPPAVKKAEIQKAGKEGTGAHRQGEPMFAFMQEGAPINRDILIRAQVSVGPAAMATRSQMTELAEQPGLIGLRGSGKAGKAPPPVTLRLYTLEYLVLDPGASAASGEQALEMAAAAYDRAGDLLNGISQNTVRSAAAGTGKDAQPYFRAVQTLEVPNGAVSLRVGIRDLHTGRIGTLEIPLPIASE